MSEIRLPIIQLPPVRRYSHAGRVCLKCGGNVLDFGDGSLCLQCAWPGNEERPIALSLPQGKRRWGKQL